MARNSLLTFAAVLLLSAYLLAEDQCKFQALMHQSKDVATVQHLETEWSLAYMRGDTDFERCLLSADFTEIARSGEIKNLDDELALAAKNQGKNRAIPELPKSTVLLHGNVAVAYGMSSSTSSDGQLRRMRYADYYLWEKGAWHAFFAQQTQF